MVHDRPLPCQGIALPTELIMHMIVQEAM